ncbi:hypothetical protein RhiirA4_424645 [Rhizophagus irregularis]|uniref:RRM domain-containing protein n=1 Tax=Rhizophagus irregularis TaxID=588596 RepID=A0A2I1GYA7_9GLOM|nr:hypothetical protein RhiirA4_424645 [Rhizophagus irregularis]
MNIDTTSPSDPTPNLVSSVPSDLPVNKVQVVTSPQTNTTPAETVDASIHASSNNNGKGKAVDFSDLTRAPSPDVSKASVQSSSTRYHTAAYLRDAPDAFKTKFTTNRVMCDKVDHAFFKFSSYGSRARCEGSGDDKRILVSFFTQADRTSSTSVPCVDLFNLVFIQYSPADMKRNVEAKSLFITDIPLFLTETQVHLLFPVMALLCAVNFLSEDTIILPWFSSVLKIRSPNLMTRGLSFVLAIPYAQFVAVLAGIPKNIKEADLTDIANQVSAKAINIPLSFTSYKPKPYVYMNFFSQETLDAAKELTVSFRNRGLTWHSSDQTSSNNSAQQPKTRPHTSTSSSRPTESSDQYKQPICQPIITPPTTQSRPIITPEEVAALRQQILELSKTIRSMDERIDWFSAQLESHEYRIVELENTVFPDNNPCLTYEHFDAY